MVVDLHVDCILQHEFFGYRIERRHRAGLPGQPILWHADLPRMREAGYGGACLGIHWWPWESESGWQAIRRQIEYLDEVAASERDVLRVRKPSDWERAEESSSLALAPGVEGAHTLNGRLERAERLGELGVSYLTLTHFSKNSAATPSMGRGSNESDGLSAFGRDLVVALEEHGVRVDLAHVNTPGVLEACEVAREPLLCTHTGVKGVHDSPRNLTDAEIDAVAATGGVIGIIFAPSFLAGRLLADTGVVADHVEYVAERVGVEHVAVGSDYDGWIPTIPRDQRDCRDIDRLWECLDERGWSEEAIEAVAGRNALELLAARRDGDAGSAESPQ